MAFLVRRFLAQYGRLVLIVGAIIMSVGCMGILGWMALGAVRPVRLIPVLLLACVGMGLVSGPLGAVSVARVERQQAGSASGIIKTVQQMGVALGIALVGSAYLRLAESGRGEAAALAVMLALLALCLFWAARLPKEIFPRKAGKGTMAEKKHYHRENLKRDLFEAGRDFVQKHGHHELSMRMLAQLADVSPGASYHHFADRRAILLAVAIDGYERLLNQVIEPQETDLLPVEKIKAGASRFVRF
ncbi:hypothetical protein E4T56_gene4300, partial [Termitomyces sp. T112]